MTQIFMLHQTYRPASDIPWPTADHHCRGPTCIGRPCAGASWKENAKPESAIAHEEFLRRKTRLRDKLAFAGLSPSHLLG